MATNTTLFRARVPAHRLKKVEKILEQLGMKPGDAFQHAARPGIELCARGSPSTSPHALRPCCHPMSRHPSGRRRWVPTDARVGEVWFADLAMAEKSRPVLVLAVPGDADARALVIVAPLTSQIRGMRGEVNLGKPRWLSKPSAVNVQGLASFDYHKTLPSHGNAFRRWK